MVLLEEETEVESQSQPEISAEERLCISCSEPIPLLRLKAMPITAQCVPCLEAQGDVARIKRHDDYIGRHGDEVVSTYYKGPHQYIDLAVKKLMTNKTFASDPDEQKDVEAVASTTSNPYFNPGD